MAKRRRTRTIAPYRAPQIRVNVPRPIVVGARGKVRRRRSGGGGGSLTHGLNTRVVAAAGAVGFLAKAVTLPRIIDGLGEVGNVALYAYLAHRFARVRFASDIATAAAAIALYQFASTGSVSGDDGVAGVAAQS